MDSKALVQLALAALSCNHKELATQVGVSPAQISKWKKGEYMSVEMQERMRSLSKLGDLDPSFVMLAGSLDQAYKWEKLIKYLAELAHFSAETGYDTYPLIDEQGLLCSEILQIIQEIGVPLPKEFPKELEVDFEAEQDISSLIDSNVFSKLIYNIFCSLNDIYGFYAAYISELIHDDELNLYDTEAANIEPYLLSLAACKVTPPRSAENRFLEFQQKIIRDYKIWLGIVKDRAFRAGKPLRAELLHLVHRSSDELGHEAEAESLGFNSDRIHPDIYMNELLTGMRVIHQVLPAIIKKLDIDFELDTSDFRIK